MSGESRQQALGACQNANPDHPPATTAWALGQIENLEDVLVDRAIAIAKTNGYAPYTTTLRAAWREAVRSLTEALGHALCDNRPGPGGPQAEIEYRKDPRFARMRAIARTHRSVGISLELYLGLFKHFRRIYLDALGGLDLPKGARADLLARALDFFDESELSVTADWTAAGEAERLRELQARARALTLKRDRYVAIFESLRNPAFLLDQGENLVHANKAALDLFVGQGEEGDGLYLPERNQLAERLGPVLTDVLGVDRAPSPEDTVERVAWLETSTGWRCFDVRLRPLHDAVQNTALGQLLQLYDVTAHREATEQAQRAERQMSRFLATMSHEIRTPLHSVLGAADLLRKSEDAARDTYLDVIQSAGQSLLLTLNNVLDFSKLENGSVVPQPTDIEIRPALEAVCAMAAIGPDAERSALSLVVEPNVPDRVRIDWAMTRQVLTNLLSNAVRHDGGRGVRLRVAARGTDPGGVLMRFEVADHGPGLSDEAAEALRRPFDETNARHTTQGGAGLGLAISGHLVGSMGGRMDFTNVKDGTEIWFEIPASHGAVCRTDAPTKTKIGPVSGGRCLLVDDDQLGAIVSRHQLASIGFEVDHAKTLSEARGALAARNYDAVVVDYLLPDGTGPELLDEIAAGPEQVSPRLVGLSANAEALHACETARAGFHAVLAKPADASTLAKALLRQSEPTAVSATSERPRVTSLEGLSEETVAAMIDAFREQWSAFRDELADLRGGAPSKIVADLAHRLAGTTAQLGLVDLEDALRELERRSRLDASDVDDLLGLLDQPLESKVSWHQLLAVEDVQ
ncbi:MAG: ATP-binding protein [Pseudomonadota bacterium]